MCKLLNIFKLKVYLDGDDVLLNTNQFSIDKLNKEFNTSYTLTDVTSWGKTGSTLDLRIKYFSDPEFMRNIPVLEGAREFVEELQKRCEVFVCTSVEPQCISARAEALKENFPTIPPSNYVFTSRKELIDGDVLLDDGAHNIVSAQVKYPVLFRKPWNHHLTGTLSVNSYDDFIHFIDLLLERRNTPNLKDGGVLCLIGPPCSHKTEISTGLCEEDAFLRPKTYTTSKKNNALYCSISNKQFSDMEANNEFIETTTYGSNRYGTPKETIELLVNSGSVVVLPVDICGALALRRKYKEKCLLVFCERSKEEILFDYLDEKVDKQEKINTLMSLDKEMSIKSLCDISVDANDVEGTIKKIISFIEEEG